ncbi:MAG: histidine phosphatase family protein [Hyphomicrobium sp.]|nr:histidine phosphatase family protein [Hyphomicrobium sp.]
MIPKRPFYFLRHGETDWNREGRYQGHADVPLNAAGLAQAKAAGEALAGAEITRIVTSPLVRALKTAAVVAERLERPLHVDRGLIERSFGAFDGQVIREVKERHGLRPDQSSRDVLPADADPWTEIFERIPPVIARWMIAHPQERLLFVAHSGVFDAIHEHMLGARAGPESRHGMPYLAAPTDAGWALDALL